jgi:aspartate/tyrosine/aromatic aminotransferase
MEGLLADLNSVGLFANRVLESQSVQAEEGSIILLHACAHNPSGIDPSSTEWQQIISTCGERRHMLFFDNAYQG